MTTPRVKTYSVPEACRLLGIGRVTLWRLTRQRKVRATRLGRRVVYRETELEKFLDRQTC